MVWKLDRLSRSLNDVLHIMERIADAGTGFRSLTENIDTIALRPRPASSQLVQEQAAGWAEPQADRVHNSGTAAIENLLNPSISSGSTVLVQRLPDRLARAVAPANEAGPNSSVGPASLLLVLRQLP